MLSNNLTNYTFYKDFIRHRHSSKLCISPSYEGVIISSNTKKLLDKPQLINPNFYSVKQTILDEFWIYKTRIILYKNIEKVNYDPKNIKLSIAYGDGMKLDLLSAGFGRQEMIEQTEDFISSLIAHGVAVNDKAVFGQLANSQNRRILIYILIMAALFVGWILGNIGLSIIRKIT